MAPVRSGVLARVETPVASVSATFGTVPAGTTWILKSIAITSNNAAQQTVQVYTLTSLGTIGVYLINQLLAAQASLYWTGWHAMAPGDTLGYFESGGPIRIWASGAALPGSI